MATRRRDGATRAETAATIEIDRLYREALPAIRARSAALVGPSLAEQVAALPAAYRDELLDSLTPAELRSLLFEWRFWARPKQLPPPGTWRFWLLLAGRGLGKSRTGSEFIRWRVEECGARTIALVGPTLGDVRNFMLGGHEGVEGNGSGLLDVFPEEHKPIWHETRGLVEFHTGAIAYIVTAEEPEYRGANLDTMWLDEFAKWKYLDTLFDNLELAFRSNAVEPQGIITTTPKPLALLKRLVGDPDVFTTLGSTDENKVNLNKSFLRRLDKRFAGSATEQQERHGEILEDTGSTLWTHADIAPHRVVHPPALMRVLVCVDPSTSDGKSSDETGIVVVGLGIDGELYVLADLSGKYSPEKWGAIVIAAVRTYAANGVLVEGNRVGQMAAANVRAAMRRSKQGTAGELAAEALPIIEIKAIGDKGSRAEPVATLYRRGQVHHVGVLAELEAEQTSWLPASYISPNRVDALVHGVTLLAGLDDDEVGDQPYQGTSAPRRVGGGLRQSTDRDDWDLADDD